MDLHQRRFSSCYCVGELGQVAHSQRTLLVEDPDWDQSDTSTQVLEGQVETLFTQVADVSHFCVQLQDTVTNVHLWMNNAFSVSFFERYLRLVHSHT